jgi:hypothetical protein
MRERSKSSMLVLLGCVAFLLVFGLYIWTATVVHPPGAGPEGARSKRPPHLQAQALRARLSVDPAPPADGKLPGPAAPVAAQLVLGNAGPQPVTVLDAPLPSALVDLRLHFLGPDGKAPPRRLWATLPLAAPPNPAIAGATGAKRGDPTFGLVKLLPGRELRIQLPLMPPFDVSAPGVYRLEVRYQPARYCEAWKLDPGELGVFADALEVEPAQFRVQLSGASIPPAPPEPKP